MNSKELLTQGIKMLCDKECGLLEAQMLLAHVLKMERTKLLVYGNRQVAPHEEMAYLNLLKKRLLDVPVQYLIGECEFMSLPFSVDESVLIPRCDTEVLVEDAIQEIGMKNQQILDLCCGSGCIGVSIAYYLKDTSVTFVDISERALEIAKVNAERNRVIERCDFCKLDILKEIPENTYDSILSNPPYIPKKDIETLEPEVKDNEPRLALEAEDDGFKFYQVICDNAPMFLKGGGLLSFEVGIGQADKVAQIMSKSFEQIIIKKDLAGIKRVVKGRKK